MKLPKKNWLEWTVFGISFVLVASMLGYLGYTAVTAGSEPPQLEVELGTPEPQPGGYAIPVTVHDRGDETAEGVQVAVVLTQGEREIERGEFEIAFVPRGSSGEGWVVFRSNPGDGELRGVILGYEQP